MKNFRSPSNNKFPKKKASFGSKFPGRAVDDDPTFAQRKSDSAGDHSKDRPSYNSERRGEKSFSDRPKEGGARFSSNKSSSFKPRQSSNDHFFKKNDGADTKERSFAPREGRPFPSDDRPRKQFVKKYEERGERSSGRDNPKSK